MTTLAAELCATCIPVKDKAVTYTRCKRCGGWRLLTAEEKDKVKAARNPARFK